MRTISHSLVTLFVPALLAACSAGSTPPDARPGTGSPVVVPQSQPAVDTKTVSAKDRSKDDVKARLLSLFSAREQHNTKQDLLALGPASDVEIALADIATDENAKLQHRLAAVGSMRWFTGSSTRATLEDAIKSPGGNVALRRSAVGSYGAAFGEESIPLLTKTLAHDDVHTRMQSILALHDVGTPAARAAVEGRMAVESDEAVKMTGKKALDTWK